MPHDDQSLTPRKLTHRQARLEQLLYCSKRSIAERLGASAALTKRLDSMRGIEIDDGKQI